MKVLNLKMILRDYFKDGFFLCIFLYSSGVINRLPEFFLSSAVANLFPIGRGGTEGFSTFTYFGVLRLQLQGISNLLSIYI